jgi:glucokinase-like ROK family protein
MSIVKGDPEFAREINKLLILDYLRRHEKVSRVAIARSLNLTKGTISTIINNLINQKLVIEIGEGTSQKQGGRKPVLLSLNSSEKYVIGVDIGTTSIVIALSNLRGEVLKKNRIPTSHNKSVDNITRQVEIMIKEMINDTKINKENIIGCGISVAGVVEKNNGLVVVSPDFNWKNVTIKKIFEETNGLDMVFDNCTRVMTLGEKWYGLAKNVENAFFVNVGYGIGSAIIINGEIYNNHSEFGHVFITKKPIKCDCGKFGCLEAVSSGHAIEREARKLIGDKDSKGEKITAKRVAELAIQGNKVAKQIFSDAGIYLGRAISMVTNIFNPEIIILGGGVSLAGRLFLDSIIEEFNNHTMEPILKRTKIEISKLGMDAGVLGAISLALDNFIFNPESIILIRN